MTTLSDIMKRRNRRVDLEGLPPATFRNTGDIDVDTSAGGWIIDFSQESLTKVYCPYSSISVNNTSDSDLNVYVNQNQKWKKICRANSEIRIRDFPGIRSVRISKVDASVTVAADEVEVNVERDAIDENEVIRREYAENPLVKLGKRFIFG